MKTFQATNLKECFASKCSLKEMSMKTFRHNEMIPDEKLGDKKRKKKTPPK